MKTYEYWLKYYENATKEQVIEDSMHDIEEITKLQQENKQLKEEIEEYKRIEQKDLEAFNNYDSILTELEEWLKENAGICRLNQKYTTNQVYGLKEDAYYKCLNKIQELKEKYK